MNDIIRTTIASASHRKDLNMSDKLFDTCYMWFPRTSAQVRQRMPTWRCIYERIVWGAETAWKDLQRMHDESWIERPDPADFIIVAGFVTDEKDERGARIIRADWERTYDPQSFYEEVERERRLAEERG